MNSSSHAPVRPALETLEDRLAPALLRVVPVSGLNGFNTFVSLSDAALSARPGDVIQVEPGSDPGGAGFAVPNLTVQGDPAFGGAGGLRASNTLAGTLTFLPGSANNEVVRGLFLQAVNLAAGSTGGTIAGNVFAGPGGGVRQTFSAGTTPVSNGGNTVSGNAFLGGAAVVLGNAAGDAANTAAGDKVLDNFFDFTGFAAPALTASNEGSALLVAGNRFVDATLGPRGGVGGSGTPAVALTDCVGAFTGNTLRLVPFDEGVQVSDTAGTSRTTDLTLSGNVLATGGATGIRPGLVVLHRSTANNFSVSVTGNALAGNLVGVLVLGNQAGGANDFGTVALHGNDLRGYSGAGGNFAVQLSDAANSASAVSATGNVFGVADPQTVVSAAGAPGAAVDTSGPLAGGPANLTAMFLTLGGGPPTSAQVSALGNAPAAAQAAAAVRSSQAVTAFVDGLYVSLLGRAPVGGEDQFWVNLVTGGGTEEQVVVGFATSAEYYGRVGQGGASPNGAWVQSLYLNLLGRQGSAAEINFWLGVAQSQGLAAVAAGVVGSMEFRSRQVEAYYGAAPVGVVPASDLLKRGAFPSPGEVAFWASSSGDLLAVQAAMLASGEFGQNG